MTNRHAGWAQRPRLSARPQCTLETRPGCSLTLPPAAPIPPGSHYPAHAVSLALSKAGAEVSLNGGNAVRNLRDRPATFTLPEHRSTKEGEHRMSAALQLQSKISDAE